jgi:hypothetical protein
MTEISIIALILSGLFSGYLLAGLLMLPALQRLLGTDQLLTGLLPGFLRTAVILGIAAGLGNALTSKSMPAFLLAIIAMSLILSRTHLLRLVLTNRAEGQGGDLGAMRMYRVALFLFSGLYAAQLTASVIAVYLQATG